MWKRTYLEKRARGNKPIQWYEEPGLDAGAFATMLGLCIDEANGGTWEAIAIGDSCLFQIRNRELLVRFPMDASGDFDNFPRLLSSLPQKNNEIDNIIRGIGGRWRIHDRFYLATDALAQWFLREFEKGNEPWENLDEMGSQRKSESSEGWIVELRKQKLIRNDDVALLRINLE